jgi:hypothetical protein
MIVSVLTSSPTLTAPVRSTATSFSAGCGERRDAVRVDVELSGTWRRAGSYEAPTLALISDLSTRGARIAGWIPLQFEVGDEIELRIAGGHVAQARVARVLGDGEYGVRFERRSDAFRDLLAKTVGRARAGLRDAWAID